jgi:hypothetical protein
LAIREEIPSQIVLRGKVQIKRLNRKKEITQKLVCLKINKINKENKLHRFLKK